MLTGKVLAALLAKISSGVGTGVRWSVYRHCLDNQKKHYDVAISYLDFFCNYYVSEKVRADKKIVYNHMDYEYGQIGGWPCPKLERKSFSNSDFIVSVAESSKQSLVSYFPEFAHKIRVIHNTVSPETIKALSKENLTDTFYIPFAKYHILTVARLVEEKGVYLALYACKHLIDQGYDICWSIIGGGPLLEDLKSRAVELGLKKRFILLGEKANPYPFMKSCDVYVQPSRTEAHSVAVEEAMALALPIVVTDIPSFKNQIEHGKSGMITSTNPESISEGISQCLDSKKLRESLSNYLKYSE